MASRSGSTVSATLPPRRCRSTGTYTLLVEGYIVNTSPVNYSFNVQNITNTTAALTLGSQVNGAITQPGSSSTLSTWPTRPSFISTA